MSDPFSPALTPPPEPSGGRRIKRQKSMSEKADFPVGYSPRRNEWDRRGPTSFATGLEERCINWPCAGKRGHKGPCSTSNPGYPRSHDWVGPTRHNVYVHCSACDKIFEVGKAKGVCYGPPQEPNP